MAWTATLDAGGVGRTRAFAPADEAVVGGELDDHVGDAAAVDQRAGLDALVGDADRDGFELDDFHDGRSTSDLARNRHVEPSRASM